MFTTLTQGYEQDCSYWSCCFYLLSLSDTSFLCSFVLKRLNLIIEVHFLFVYRGSSWKSSFPLCSLCVCSQVDVRKTKTFYRPVFHSDRSGGEEVSWGSIKAADLTVKGP